MPGSSERLKHSADVGGGEMKAGEGCVRGAEGGCRRKGGGGEGWGVVGSLSDSQKTVPHSVRPSLSAARKTTLEFLTASARWSQDEFIGAMHNAKGRDYHIAAAPGPWQRELIGDMEGGPWEALVFPLASGEVSVHSWETWRSEGSERGGGGRFTVMVHLATGSPPIGAGAS